MTVCEKLSLCQGPLEGRGRILSNREIKKTVSSAGTQCMHFGSGARTQETKSSVMRKECGWTLIVEFSSLGLCSIPTGTLFPIYYFLPI